jgi:hypothetical protein
LNRRGNSGDLAAAGERRFPDNPTPKFRQYRFPNISALSQKTEPSHGDKSVLRQAVGRQDFEQTLRKQRNLHVSQQFSCTVAGAECAPHPRSHHGGTQLAEFTSRRPMCGGRF